MSNPNCKNCSVRQRFDELIHQDQATLFALAQHGTIGDILDSAEGLQTEIRALQQARAIHRLKEMTCPGTREDGICGSAVIVGEDNFTSPQDDSQRYKSQEQVLISEED